MFDLGALFRELYNTVIDLSGAVQFIFDWLMKKQTFGFHLFGELIGIEIVPINVIGASGILLLVGFWLIKALVPFG